MRGRITSLICSAIAACAVMATGPAVLAGTSTCPVLHWGTFTGAPKVKTLLTPTAVSIPGHSQVIQVGSSNSDDYALLANGTLWAWGEGGFGELGNGTTERFSSTPVRVEFPKGVSIAYIPVNSMPWNTALAVDTNGNVWGWGYNSGGPLCLGNQTSYDRPVELPFTNVTSLAGAAEHAVYDSGGVLYSCGLDAAGVLGAGRKVPYDSLTPVKVKILNGSDVTSLVSSYQNSGALLSNGQYYDWGLNNEGQLGDGSTADSPVPVLVSIPDQSPVVQAALGGSLAHNGETMVKLADGTEYGWGDNAYKQLDAGASAAQLTPLRLRPPAGVTYSILAANGGTTYEITTANDVYARGWGRWGQIGDGSRANASKPVMVLSGMSLISATAKNVVVAC